MHERLGKYELVRHLASGGMASVYLARLSGLGGFQRHVVLKTLRADGLPDETLVPMFLDEARLIATLHHQHIAQVFEVGCEEQTYFLAMEYVHGETVRSVLETAIKHGIILPREFALTVVCAAAAGLHHAHERRDAGGSPLGIVHRDVTPSNVIVSYDGSVKLIDFGIAKANDRSIKTRSGMIKGKAGYMAPEQVKGYPVDRRSDVFALGVLAYELTTQCRAFQAETQFEQLERIANGRLARPSEVVPHYPPELERVVMQALEVDPDDRYPDADAVRVELERVAGELGLVLGAPPVMRVLEELYGPRPEPWLLTPGQIDYDVTPSIPDLPFAIEVSGSNEQQAVPEPVALDATVPVDEASVVEVVQTDFVRGPATRVLFGIMVALTVVAAAIVAVVIAIQASPEDTVSLAIPAPPEPPAPAPAPNVAKRVAPPRVEAPQPAPRPDRVMLEVITEPPDATVVLDGVRLGKSPFRAEVPARPKAILKVRRYDRTPVRVSVSLAGDLTWKVTLPPKRR